jgi:dTDP-4-dehydrorhamnose 3,5-epimerase
MNIQSLAIDGVKVVETYCFRDKRGAFSRLFCEEELAPVIGSRRIIQINHSRTASVGTIRGMHYQAVPCAEMKLIRCLKGRVWDVALDLRQGSPTFLCWYARELSSDNNLMMLIPEGFAHGFQTLEADCELLYLHTAEYAPDHEGGVRYDDPAIGIPWPLAVTEVSKRDRCHPLLDSQFEGLEVNEV